MKPKIGITMGDASGVGPEIIIKAIESMEVHDLCIPIVIGDAKIISRDIENCNSKLEINKIEDPRDAVDDYRYINLIDLDILPNSFGYGKISKEAGHASFEFIKKAVELAKDNKIDSICTAPLNKEALHKGGHQYPGHTEILAGLTDTKSYSMMLSSPYFKVIHLTTHIGLKDAIETITPNRTLEVINLADSTLKRAGITNPRIAVCGINPHAGEGGLFGNNEEEEKLIPAINEAKAQGKDVYGPLAADTLFFLAKRGDFDIVIACYHDQGHIPIKLLGIDEGVNITVGLNYNIIRTSVDHGTAFDISGKNIADYRSMVAAMKDAVSLINK